MQAGSECVYTALASCAAPTIDRVFSFFFFLFIPSPIVDGGEVRSARFEVYNPQTPYARGPGRYREDRTRGKRRNGVASSCISFGAVVGCRTHRPIA